MLERVVMESDGGGARSQGDGRLVEVVVEDLACLHLQKEVKKKKK